MTAQKDQLQSLIGDIDRALLQPSPKFPWQATVRMEQYRYLLQQTRHGLHQLLAAARAELPTSHAQEVIATMVREMQELRMQLLRPLHAEVSSLTEQRNALLQEVRQLEAQRQSHLAQPAPSSVTPEDLQQVHDRADTVISSLDSTLRVVFESLQRDIHAYHDSLTQGLDNMHNVGRQSEAVFSGLVTRLAEQLGRDASVYLHTPEGQSLEDAEHPVAEPKLMMPYAGAELSSPPQDAIHTLTQLLEHLTLDLALDPEHQAAAPAPIAIFESPAHADPVPEILTPPATTVFSLEGIDDLFVEDEKDMHPR